MTADLSHISSIATIDGFLPDNGEGIKKAFKGADIVVIPAGIPREYILHATSEMASEGRAGHADRWDNKLTQEFTARQARHDP